MLKLVFTEKEKKEVDIGEMVAVNLGSILILPITASSIIHSFDYDNDGVLSKDEVMSDSEFSSLVGIDAKQIQKGINFDEVGKNTKELIGVLPIPK